MRWLYLLSGIIAVVIQIMWLDHYTLTPLGLPLLIIVTAYWRHGLEDSVIIGTIIAWAWDFDAAFFGWRAAIMLLMILTMHLAKNWFVSQVRMTGRILLSLVGLISWCLYSWLLVGFQLGFPRLISQWAWLSQTIIGLVVGVVMISLADSLARRWHYAART